MLYKIQNLVKSIIAVSLLFMIQPAYSNLSGFVYGSTHNDNIMPGQINIKIESFASPFIMNSDISDIVTGIPSMDAVTDAFSVYKIKKSFRMESAPKDPNIPDLSCWYTVYFPEEINPEVVKRAYEKCPEVEIAETVPKMKLEYEPNDPRFRNQWHLEHCGLPRAWDVTHGSEEIIIGIIDGGIEMNIDNMLIIHEDLEDNLWINEGEDIAEPFGAITLDDLNDRDDDDNGYVDDFHGWDFGNDDNWPDDYWDYGHGTHVAGDVSAVTDNETGVAGAGFNCKLMICAHYSLREPGYVSEWWRGVEYCVDNGAKVINFSFGSIHTPYQISEEAVEYALENDCIIFASAGNGRQYIREEDREHHYPSDYDGVICVAGCEQDDGKYSLSNYGDFIDLVAPAIDVLAPWDDNTYVFRPGTSVASPIAAGIGALALSVRPDLNADELLEWMQETAVDISEQNEDYPGIRYRVDAGNLLRSTVPDYQLTEHCFVEMEGDQDGNFDRGETIGISLSLANTEGHLDAEDVIIRLENEDEYIQIDNGEVNIGDLDAGEEIELTGEQYLTFIVADDSPRHYTTFNLTVSADDEWTQTFRLTIPIPHPHFLLVDDDAGDDFETYYHEDMMERPIVHHVWNIAEDGVPSVELLTSYSFVIWETGNSETPLSEEDQSAISGFLDSGGCLLLSGQFIGDDIGDTPFHSDYLRARHTTNDTGDPMLDGVEGSELTGGISIILLGAGGAGNGRVSPSAMEPIEGAEPIFTYSNGEVGGIYYASDYHLVYLGFAMEAISGAANTTSRVEVLELILDHFYALLSVESDNSTILPTDYTLSTPYPNPFNAVTRIAYAVPSAGHVRLAVYDISGRMVGRLVDEDVSAGRHVCEFDGGDLAAGLYFVRLEAGSDVLIRKVVMVK